MPGPIKKKRSIRSSATLHDFFGPGAASLAKQRDKTQTIQCKTTPKTRKNKETAAPHDVIIIDSDSEDEPKVLRVQLEGAQATKRRRLSESSSEVEFVDQLQPYKSSTAQTGKRAVKTPSENKSRGSSTKKFFTPPCRSVPGGPLTLNSKLQDVAFPSFGTPSLLLPTPARPPPPSSPTSSISSSFGPPTLLASTDEQSSETEHHRPPSCPSPPPDVSNSVPYEDSSKVDIDLSNEDEWGTGDDETTFEPSVNEELEIDNIYDTANSASLELSGFFPTGGVALSQTDMDADSGDCLNSTTEGISFNAVQTLTLPSTPQVHGPLELISCHGKTRSSANNAFSVLMSSHKENEAWKEASAVEDQRQNKRTQGRPKAPFYKVLQGMPIAVDAFRYGTIPSVTAYFLTHAHSDHYTNLSSNWKSGPIYCSECTANLIVHMLAVDRKWVYPLPMDVPTVVPNTGGVTVTLIEANHCPGSCLFYFEGPQTVDAGDSAFKSPFVGSSKIFRYLHCGDFRASPRHILHPAVKGKRIDHVYLDTTYLDSKYTFPPQPLVISACADLAQRISSGRPISHSSPTMSSWMVDHPKGKAKENKVLMVIGTYSIGKERIVKAIAQALQSKVYCDARKTAILRCQADPELHALLTSDPLDACVHLVPLGVITSDKLKTYMERFSGKFTKAVGFRPTGWTYTQPAGTDQLPPVSSIISPSNHKSFTYANLRPARNSTSMLQLFPVPYSEHSSFFELTCFAMSFNWGKMIATVNVGSENSRGKMAKWVAKWEAERKKRGKDILVPPRHPDYW